MQKSNPKGHCETSSDIDRNLNFFSGACSHCHFVWLGGVVVGRRISDREVASSIPGCSAARCNSGQVVHTLVPLFTKQHKLVPAAAGE